MKWIIDSSPRVSQMTEPMEEKLISAVCTLKQLKIMHFPTLPTALEY